LRLSFDGCPAVVALPWLLAQFPAPLLRQGREVRGLGVAVSGV
jgi:hypothetical protein